MLSPLHIVRNGATTRRIIIVISYAVVEVFSPNLPPNGHCIYAICSRPIGFSQYGTFCCARLASIRINPHGRSKHIFSIQLTADYIEPGRPGQPTRAEGFIFHIVLILWRKGQAHNHTHIHTMMVVEGADEGKEILIIQNAKATSFEMGSSLS